MCFFINFLINVVLKLFRESRGRRRKYFTKLKSWCTTSLHGTLLIFIVNKELSTRGLIGGQADFVYGPESDL